MTLYITNDVITHQKQQMALQKHKGQNMEQSLVACCGTCVSLKTNTSLIQHWQKTVDTVGCRKLSIHLYC